MLAASADGREGGREGGRVAITMIQILPFFQSRQSDSGMYSLPPSFRRFSTLPPWAGS